MSNWYLKHWPTGTKERVSLGYQLYEYLVKHRLDSNIQIAENLKDCFRLETGEVYFDKDYSWQFSTAKETTYGERGVGYTLQFKYRKFDNKCYSFALVIDEEVDSTIKGTIFALKEITQKENCQEITIENYQDLFLDFARKLKEAGDHRYGKIIETYKKYKDLDYKDLNVSEQMKIMQWIGNRNCSNNEVVSLNKMIAKISSDNLKDFFEKVAGNIKLYDGEAE